MKTFKDIRENVTDLSGSSHRSLSTILKDPTHPMHSAAKAERDRRMHKEANESFEQLDELTAAEKKLINQLYDKNGKLTPLGKKVFATGQKND